MLVQRRTEEGEDILVAKVFPCNGFFAESLRE
jgi:hypothetical protein